MGRTQNFRRQHQEILQVAREITGLLEPTMLTQQAAHCRLLLSELAGKLSVHLAMEDNAMYPRLLQHSDPKIKELAQRYINEMGGIKKVFAEYTQKWRTEALLQKDPAAFIQETKGLFTALAERIAREDHELYDLVDKHG